MAALILLILFVLAWIILILPRQRELRRHQRLVNQLAVGDEVMMTSGIYGTIVELDGDYARLEVAPGVVLKIARRSIAAEVPVGPAPSPPRDDEADIGQNDLGAGGIEGDGGSDGGSATEVGHTDVSDGDGGDQSADLDREPAGQGEHRPERQAGGSTTEGELDDELDPREGNEA